VIRSTSTPQDIHSRRALAGKKLGNVQNPHGDEEAR